MQEFLISLSHQYSVITYIVIVVVAALEGPIISMILGVLVKLDYFAFLPIYLALMAGDLMGDVVWYYVGRHFGYRFVDRFGKYFSVTPDSIAKVSAIYHRHKDSIMFISKITNGFGFALVTLITAGIVRIPFWRYFAINAVGQLVWTALLMGIGYFFGNLYQQVDTWLGRLSVAVLFVVVFALFLGYRRYLKQRAEKMTLQ